jgi:hypothetical protein
VISTLLAAVSTWRIRAVTLGQAGRAARKPVSPNDESRRWLDRFGMPSASLDEDPVLWREVHRRGPSGWGRAIWWLYGVLSVFFTVAAIFVDTYISAGVCAFMVSIGLLMISVTSATALAEERAYVSLDVLLTTLLSTRAIVQGKWWGAFRVVPRLAVLPAVLAISAGLRSGHWVAVMPYAVLIAGLVLAYGAVITSLGLALAAWQPRLSRAVGWSVTAFLAATVIYPTIALLTMRLGPDDAVFLWVSPFFGMLIPMGWLSWVQGHDTFEGLFAMFVWIILTSAVAYALLRATIANFDRLLGRLPERGDSRAHAPKPKSLRVEPIGVASDWD